ncbi:hypothetical protein [Leptospira fainei]|uniref:hypothetical protein n=1 Tax=Leptospira fainei TaxID=48782 RepID=UPI0009FF1470|nr:hypothetical protein [Leptospira fainei]
MRIRWFAFTVSILFLEYCQDAPAVCRRECREKLVNCFALDMTVPVDSQSRISLTCYLADALCESNCNSPGGTTKTNTSSVHRSGSSSEQSSGGK